MPTCLWHHCLFSCVSHGLWKVPCSACSLLSCFCSLFLLFFAIFEATVVLYVYCVVGMMENIKCLPCGSLRKESRFLWRRWRFYTCFVKNFMARRMHYLSKVKITSWDLNDPHELTFYLFFFAFYLALYLTFSLFSQIYWRILLVPFSGIPSDNIFWHVIWRSVPAHKPAKSLGAPIPFRPGKSQRAGELAARKLAIICWHESGEVSEEAKRERRKEGRMQNIWLSPGTRGKNLQDKSKNSS